MIKSMHLPGGKGRRADREGVVVIFIFYFKMEPSLEISAPEKDSSSSETQSPLEST